MYISGHLGGVGIGERPPHLKLTSRPKTRSDL